MNFTRRGAWIGVGVLTLLLGAMAYSWACTGQAEVQLIPPLAAPGRRVTVTESQTGRPLASMAGTSRSDGRTQVQIRWNDLNGPVLAEAFLAEGEKLNAPVTIPEVPDDVYYVVAISGNEAVRTVVQVKAAGGGDRNPSAVSPELWSGFKSGGHAGVEGTPGSSPGPRAGFMLGLSVLMAGVALASASVAAVAANRRRAARG
ncbi:MAG: hypothetical protein ACRDIA_03345 [Actinomycetota bacterium]